MADQVRVNPLGQIADSVVEQLKSSGSQAAKSMVSEPAKILEQILGGDQHVEQGQAPAATQPQSQTDNLLIKKQQDDQQKTAALYQLHQQRLQDEIQYHEKRKQEEEQKKVAEVKQEEQHKQIVQLQHEQENDEAWQREVKAVQGSHEGQQSKM